MPILGTSRLRLTVLPSFGCHWESLAVERGGTWIEILRAAPSRDHLLTDPLSYGSYLLAPWSNRVAGARFVHRGASHALRPSFADGSAIHGDVRGRAWTVERAGDAHLEASLDTREHAGFDFPFALRFAHRVALEGTSVSTRLAATNVDDRPAPVGLGFHPYFRRRLTAGDEVELRVPAARVYPAVGCVPTGAAVPVDPARDLRRRAPLGDRRLDDCYTGLSQPRLSLRWPGGGVEATLDLEPGLGHVVVYTPGRDADFVAVEPVSHANDGFNLASSGARATGVVELPPGATFEVGFRLALRLT